MLSEVLEDFGGEGRPRFLIQPPVIVENEGAVITGDDVGVVINPAGTRALSLRELRNVSNVNQPNWS